MERTVREVVKVLIASVPDEAGPNLGPKLATLLTVIFVHFGEEVFNGQEFLFGSDGLLTGPDSRWDLEHFDALRRLGFITHAGDDYQISNKGRLYLHGEAHRQGGRESFGG
jgi:hypothetical protein